ncbi:hypothetical protein [Chryseobacterium sp. JM1]|nr:hypothetical protein [Chryseobacterium sp. JM1]
MKDKPVEALLNKKYSLWLSSKEYKSKQYLHTNGDEIAALRNDNI